jgi:hypothetical protein
LCYLLATDDDSATTANQPVEGSYSTGSSRQEWIIIAIESRNRYYFTGFIDGRVNELNTDCFTFPYILLLFMAEGTLKLCGFELSGEFVCAEKKL